jgi:DNA-binding transcriptional LysR family regulator
MMNREEQIARRLKLRDLSTLRTAAALGSMAKAAQLLAISQPAISKAIADLEHATGALLFDRSSRGVELTPYGRVLVKHGNAMIDELRQGLAEIDFLRDPSSGEVRIGVTEPMVLLASTAIHRLAQQYPRIVFHVTVNDTAVLHRELRHRNLDVAITRMAETTIESDLEIEVLLKDRLVVMARASNPWVRRRKVELSDLVDEPWALPPPGTFLSGFVEEVFRNRGLALPRSSVITTSVQMRVNLLETGRFLSMLPRALLQSPFERRSLAAVRIHLAETERPIGLVMLRGRSRSPVTELFVNAARKSFKSADRGAQSLD